MQQYMTSLAQKTVAKTTPDAHIAHKSERFTTDRYVISKLSDKSKAKMTIFRLFVISVSRDATPIRRWASMRTMQWIWRQLLKFSVCKFGQWQPLKNSNLNYLIKGSQIIIIILPACNVSLPFDKKQGDCESNGSEKNHGEII